MAGSRALKVAVVGCGSAGPAAAILLQRQGHEVTLFERAEACRPVGAGFLLQPGGMGVLERLGLLEPVLDHAAKVKGLYVVDSAGNDLLDLKYEELGAAYFGAGLHRPVLLEVLLRGMKEAGVGLRWGCEVARIERQAAGWMLEFEGGGNDGGWDLLIVADGARSKLRGQLGIGEVNRGYAWGAHWFIGENRGAFPEGELYQVVEGTRKLAGFLSTGREWGGSEALVSLFWSLKVADDAAWRRRPLAEWKDEVRKVCPRAEVLLDQIDDWEQVLTAHYGDVRMRRWDGDGVVVLGDAGHAMSPQLGQGVNLALADAACLADCLEVFPLQEALARYTKRRRWPLAYYQLATRQLTPWFQSDFEWLSPARRVVFRAAQQVCPLRRFMTKTMAGLVGAGFTKS